MAILRGGITQQVSTDIPAGSTNNPATVLYSGGADTITPCMIWEYASYSDGRSKQTYFPKVYYVSGGAASPKSQGTGEYTDEAYTMQARESDELSYSNRRIYKIEIESTTTT